MTADKWTLGVDLGGTKVEVALVDAHGHIVERLKQPTQVEGGPEGVAAEIAQMVRRLTDKGGAAPLGVGVGVPGQVEAASGVVRFAPNLRWRDVPLKEKLHQALNLPVVVTNDVRAATWGEWLHGAGQGVSDLICLFVGTGIGGGVVSGGRLLSGCSNTAGELGHTTVLLGGPNRQIRARFPPHLSRRGSCRECRAPAMRGRAAQSWKVLGTRNQRSDQASAPVQSRAGCACGFGRRGFYNRD